MKIIKLSSDFDSDASNASMITLYRGMSVYNQNSRGKFFSPDKEWARQFTQSGRDEEIVEIQYPLGKIYRKSPLPRAVSEKEMDQGIGEAYWKGFKALWMDEGPGEPSSVYIMDVVVEDQTIPKAILRGASVGRKKRKRENALHLSTRPCSTTSPYVSYTTQQ